MLTAEERLMKVLVEGGIVLKDATPSYSELLLAVESVIKAQLANVCPECNGNGFLIIGAGDHEATDKCPRCQGKGE